MNFAEMKEQFINGVKWYFNRDWNREDMMNLNEIPDEVHRNLKKVYLTLFCALLCSTFGSYLQWLSNAGGKFTVLSYVTSLILLYITPPGRMNARFLLLMLVAYSFGASVSAFPDYFFEIKQRVVFRLLGGITIGSGNLLYKATRTRERSEIYIGGLRYCFALTLYSFVFMLFDNSRTAFWVINIQTLQIFFMGYLVLYSQEILYDANIGHINYVNCTFTVFLHLPGIVIHAARLYLQGAQIEQHQHI